MTDGTRTLLWLWFSEVLGAGSMSMRPLLRDFPYLAEMYENRQSNAVLSRLSPAEASRARKLSTGDFEKRLELCEDKGIRILCYPFEAYPTRLRDSTAPPAVLYATGDVSALDMGGVAGVGTRHPTKYGRDAVKAIMYPLAKRGLTLISGLADGIDSEVHRAALENGARTVAVLGNGIDITYPAGNRALRAEIERSGAVVSEYPPGAGCSQHMFPQRNRIVAGLASCVVVFEAAARSGTMITANWALDDSKEVFSVPGSIFSQQSEGTNRLIRDGATPVTSADDILMSLGLAPDEQTGAEDTARPQGLAGELFDMLKDGEKSLDEVSERTGRPVGELMAALSSLELDGYAEALPGARYALKQRITQKR